MIRRVLFAFCISALIISGCASAEPDAQSSADMSTGSATTTAPSEADTFSSDPAQSTASDEVRSAFSGWVAAMTTRDVPAAVERYWDPASTPLFAQGDALHHCSGYRIESVEVDGDGAVLKAAFRVEQVEWVDGRTDDAANDEPYSAEYERDARGEWKLVRSTPSLFVIDR